MLSRLVQPRLLSTSLRRHQAAYATAAASSSPSTLLFLEHRDGRLNAASLSALTAAKQVGDNVCGVVTGCNGQGLEQVTEAAQKLPLSKLFICDNPIFSHNLAEYISPLLSHLTQTHSFTHVLCGHTALGKNVFPRVAALLDKSQVSDIIKVVSHDTFVRTIYAGNAISTVQSSETIKVVTVRPASFPATPSSSASTNTVPTETVPENVIKQVVVGLVSGEGETEKVKWLNESLTVSERPEIGSAKKIVSGGRGLKNKENFDKLLIPFADSFGALKGGTGAAAIGASRAAVDSGFADNSLQVGQTGKVVAPELYVAVGISGAIQHLAGMKDSKTIVAINKDADAPIFQVADVGLVADLFTAVPELTEKLSKK